MLFEFFVELLRTFKFNFLDFGIRVEWRYLWDDVCDVEHVALLMLAVVSINVEQVPNVKVPTFIAFVIPSPFVNVTAYPMPKSSAIQIVDGFVGEDGLRTAYHADNICLCHWYAFFVFGLF